VIDLLVGLVVAVVLVIVVSLLVMAVSLRSIARGNRVSPTVSTGAPLHWRVDPAPAARLHRRLQACVRQLHLAGVLVPGRKRQQASNPLAVELETQAVALDRRLVAVAAVKGKKRRRAELEQLGYEVERLEVLAHRLVTAAHWQSPHAPQATSDALDAVAEQLDALEAGQREIADLETAMTRVEADLDRARVLPPPAPHVPLTMPQQPQSAPKARKER
jgi:hypothetical protein